MAATEKLSKGELKQRLRMSAEKLHDDYLNDAELTICTTSLESDHFIEIDEIIWPA